MSNTCLEIRLAEKGDLQDIMAVYSHYILKTTVTFENTVPDLSEFEKRFERITAKYPWVVAVDGGIVVGYAYADVPFSARPAYNWDADLSVYLDNSCVHRGLGSRLYRVLMDILAELGYRNVYGIVTGENLASIAFHEKLGFRNVGCMKGSGYKFGKWLDVVWFEKRIAELGEPSGDPIFVTDMPIEKVNDIINRYPAL